MTGLPTLLVELDDGTGTFPYNITTYADMVSGWSVNRGRQDEFEDIEASIARLLLNNKDGRFTLGSAAYGIVVDQQVRITETAGATTSRRIVGNVQDWPVEWVDPAGLYAPCPITVVDKRARLTRRRLQSAIQTEGTIDGATRIYTLAESALATTVGDTSGNVGPTIGLAGTGTLPTFGNEGPISDATVGYFAGTVTPSGQRFEGIVDVAAPTCLEVTFRSAAPPAAGFAYLALWSGQLGLGINGGGGQLSYFTPGAGANTATVVTDDEWHHAAIRYEGGTFHILLDGVELTTTAGTAPAVDTQTPLAIGDSYTGYLANVLIFTTTLTNAQLADHAAAALGGMDESSDERVTRLASYGSIDAADLDLETGVLTAVPSQPLAGTSPAQAISDVVDAEGGTWFIAGNGDLVMQNRYHRTFAASQAAVLTLDASASDIEHDDLRVVTDKQYLFNEVEAERIGGAKQTVRNQASIDQYEQYPTSVTLLVTTDDEALGRANWIINAYSEPLPRVPQVTVDLLSASEAMQQEFLNLELGDRITITNLPSQSPVSTVDLIVEGISESQSLGGWKGSLNTVSADLFRAWIMGDATYGVMGVTTRPHY